MKKIIVKTFSICLFIYASMFAQTNSNVDVSNINHLNNNSVDQAAITEGEILNNYYSLPSKSASIKQLGEYNQAYIQQVKSTSSNDPSMSEIIQNGEFNTAGIVDNGMGNSLNVIQNGNNNTSESNIEGNKIKSVIEQNGNSNQLTQVLKGDGLNYLIQQNGKNLGLTQIENGENTKQYIVRQYGEGMKVIINHQGQ